MGFVFTNSTHIFEFKIILILLLIQLTYFNIIILFTCIILYSVYMAYLQIPSNNSFNINFVRNFLNFVRNFLNFVRNFLNFVRNFLNFVRNFLFQKIMDYDCVITVFKLRERKFRKYMNKYYKSM